METGLWNHYSTMPNPSSPAGNVLCRAFEELYQGDRFILEESITGEVGGPPLRGAWGLGAWVCDRNWDVDGLAPQPAYEPILYTCGLYEVTEEKVGIHAGEYSYIGALQTESDERYEVP